jgi:hypothetical protein
MESWILTSGTRSDGVARFNDGHNDDDLNTDADGRGQRGSDVGWGSGSIVYVAGRLARRLQGHSAGNGAIAWKARTITLRVTTLTLAAMRAAITVDSVAIVAFLTEGLVPVSITATSWSSATTDNVRKTRVSVAIVLGSRSHDAVSNSESLETVYANGWIGRECLVDTTAPVGQVVVGQSVNGRGGGNNVRVIIAIELATDLERAEVGKSIDIGDSNLVVVLGEGKV